MFVSSLVQVQVKRSVLGREDDVSSENGDPSHLTKPFKPLVRKSKLVVVDLAGSERIQKSGVYANLQPFVGFVTVILHCVCACVGLLCLSLCICV